MNEFEAEDLQLRLEAQERDRREKVQKESLWESAVQRSGNKRHMNEIRT